MLYRCVHSEGLLLWGRGPRSRPVCVPSGRHHRQQTTEGQPQAKLAKLFGESFGRVSVQVSTGKKKRFIKMQRLSRTHNNAWRHKAGGGRREAGGGEAGRPSLGASAVLWGPNTSAGVRKFSEASMASGAATDNTRNVARHPISSARYLCNNPPPSP